MSVIEDGLVCDMLILTLLIDSDQCACVCYVQAIGIQFEDELYHIRYVYT